MSDFREGESFASSQTVAAGGGVAPPLQTTSPLGGVEMNQPKGGKKWV
jgi:hypothetical protein